MKQGKRVKPTFPIEYRILIAPGFNEEGKEVVTRVAVRTVSEFTSFRYEIVVESAVSERTIHLDIRGLRAPQVSLPSSGPAVFETELPKLRGAYDVIVAKPNRETNEFSITVSEKSVTVKKNPENKFVEIVTIEEEW